MKFLKGMPKVELQKVALVVIVTLIGVGAIGNFYIAKQWDELSAEGKRLEQLKTQVQGAQTTVKSEVQNGQKRDQMKAFAEAQQQKMVSGDPFSWVVREMSLLAEKHPIRVVSLRPGEKIPNAAVARFEMFMTRLELEGSYDQIGGFIREIENNFATGHLRSLDIVSVDQNRGQCRATLDLALPLFPEKSSKTLPKPREEKKDT